MKHHKKTYESFYGKAERPSSLPWHREQIPSILEKSVKELPAGSYIVDLGCGTGVFSVYLAKLGHNVTSLDFMPKAIQFTKDRAEKYNVKLEIVQADVTDWKAPRTYDLVFDSGCLHGLTGNFRDKYKTQLLGLKKSKAPYVLIHFTKRGFLDWSPIGPRRISRSAIERFLAPELSVKDYYEEDLVNAPPSISGRGARIAHYLFI